MTELKCERCQAPLHADAAYCDECGQRTGKARRLVRLAIRVEVLFFGATVLMVAAFAWANYLNH